METPALTARIISINDIHGKIDTNVPFYQYSFSPMTDVLKATGAKVYNCFYDDEDAMATEFINGSGKALVIIPEAAIQKI